MVLWYSVSLFTVAYMRLRYSVKFRLWCSLLGTKVYNSNDDWRERVVSYERLEYSVSHIVVSMRLRYE